MFKVHKLRWEQHGTLTGWSYSGRGDQPWGFDDPQIGTEQIMDTLVLMRAPNGRRYPTMRNLLAGFRLRLCGCDRKTDPLIRLNLCLRAISLDLHKLDLKWMIDDVLESSIGHMEDYLHWLEVEELIRCDGSRIADTVLSPEGRAVMYLLDITGPGSNFDTSREALRELRRPGVLPTFEHLALSLPGKPRAT